MNQVLKECHAARTARRESGESEYTRPRMLSQFRGTLEDDPDDDSLPERPTAAELDALEKKYRMETPAAVSEPLGLPVEAAAWQLADGTLVQDNDPYADWEARARGEGVEALAAARVARAAAEADAPPSPAGSLPSPAGNPESDLGRAIDAAIREADEALAEIGLDDAAEPLPESPEPDDGVTAEPAAEPKAEPTTPTAEPKAEPVASGAKADGAKYDGAKYDDAKDDRGAKYDGAKADSKEAPGTDNAVSPGDSVSVSYTHLTLPTKA